jgi:hypothetical protein
MGAQRERLDRMDRLQFGIVLRGQARSEPDDCFVQGVVADMHQQSLECIHRMLPATTPYRLRTA